MVVRVGKPYIKECKFHFEALQIKYTEFQVGPIPIDDGIGKEIVTQVTTAMKSNKTFYTDASGRDFLERVCCVLTFVTIYQIVPLWHVPYSSTDTASRSLQYIYDVSMLLEIGQH